jgi:hypothetical protein
MKNLVAIVVASLVILACAGPPPGQRSYTIDRVSVGMSEQHVIALMGPPSRVSADSSATYLVYLLVDDVNYASFRILPRKETKSEYFVKLVDGHVTAFGPVGESGSEDLGNPTPQTGQ